MAQPRRFAALVALVLVLGGCGGQELPGAPRALRELLDVLPAAVLDRPAYFTDRTRLEGGVGFGSVLPLAQGAAFGLDPDRLTAVLETAGPPVTLLRGEIDPAAVAGRFTAVGYRRRTVGSWQVLERSEQLPSGAAPLVTAVPAVAVRRGLAVLSGGMAVAAVVNGDTPAAAVDWVRRLVDGVGENAAAAVFGPRPDFAVPAARAGTDRRALLAQAGVETPLARYEGYALSFGPGEDGALVLAYGPGQGGTDAAAQLAVRLATARMLGDLGRRPADTLDAGAPRWRESPRLVVLPVHWEHFDAAQVRADVEGGAFAFLAPLDAKEAEESDDNSSGER